MSKELEALKRIDEKNYLTEREHKEFYSIIENALLELKAIREANPSEALKCLEIVRKVYANIFENELLNKEGHNYFDIIKQALLKAQKDNN